MSNARKIHNTDVLVTEVEKREKSLKDMVMETQTDRKKVKSKEAENTAVINAASSNNQEKDQQINIDMPIVIEKKKEQGSRAPGIQKYIGETIVPDNVIKVKETEPKRKVKTEKKGKVNKTSVLAILLCIISLLFATDVVTSAKITSFLRAITESASEKVESTDVENTNNPVISVSDTNSISKGRLATTISDEQARLNQIAENSRVYCIISSSPYFENADRKGALFISNPTESVYYTQVVIKTKDTEKEIYISPVLAPDEKVENDYLTDHSLPSGQYQANAYFNYYTKVGNGDTPDDFSYIGTMCAEVQIVIDNK